MCINIYSVVDSGMEVSRVNQCRIGFDSKIQLNNFNKKIYFGQENVQDSFQSTSPLKLCDEALIRKQISQNSEIRRILSENHIPNNLNMTELNELMKKHAADTQNVAAAIASNLPMALKQKVNIKNLKDAAMLHDFGKVLIPNEILNKNGPLTPEERRIMDLHSELGYQLLKNTNINNEVLNLVRYHHNNIETTQHYVPDINLQILHLADKYSALTENRVYKEAFSPQKALTIIYSDVKSGEVHPFLFNALVKAVNNNAIPQNVNKC